MKNPIVRHRSSRGKVVVYDAKKSLSFRPARNLTAGLELLLEPGEEVIIRKESRICAATDDLIVAMVYDQGPYYGVAWSTTGDRLSTTQLTTGLPVVSIFVRDSNPESGLRCAAALRITTKDLFLSEDTGTGEYLIEWNPMPPPSLDDDDPEDDDPEDDDDEDRKRTTRLGPLSTTTFASENGRPIFDLLDDIFLSGATNPPARILSGDDKTTIDFMPGPNQGHRRLATVATTKPTLVVLPQSTPPIILATVVGSVVVVVTGWRSHRRDPETSITVIDLANPPQQQNIPRRSSRRR